MGYKDIREGEYVAKPLGMRLIKSQTGKTAIEVAFNMKFPLEQNKENVEKMYWQGWLSPAAIENTMKTLVEVLEFSGDQTLDADGIFCAENVITKNDIKLVIELEARTKDGAQVFDQQNNPIYDPKVKWVNRIGGSAYVGVAPQTAQSEFAAVNFKSHFLAAKQKVGQNANNPAPAPAPAPNQQQQQQQAAPLPNHAPGANNPPQMNTNDTIPF